MTAMKDSPALSTPTRPDTPAAHGVVRIASGALSLMIPVLLVLISVRLVMTPLFLSLEYNRPGFPADFYGFTTEDRLRLAPYALDYLLLPVDIDYLGDLTFEDGSPLYNARELQHMVDVKNVTQAAFSLLIVLSITSTVIIVALAWRKSTRGALAIALMTGGALTLMIIITIAVSVIVAWDFFFTGFHEVFFADGTWIFAYSDTLIRLFPEQFWFDAALTIGVLTIGGAVALTAGGWAWARRLRIQAQPS